MKGSSLQDFITEFTALVPATYRFDQMRPVGDELIEAIVKAFSSAPLVQRVQATDSLSPEAGVVLWNYAREAAVRAVRDHDTARITNGLVALAIQNGKPDVRDSIVAMAMLFRSSQILGIDVVPVFGDAAKLVPDELLSSEMRGFPFRRKEDRDIEAYFIFERATAEGFSYEQRPWDFKPAIRKAKIRRLMQRFREMLS